MMPEPTKLTIDAALEIEGREGEDAVQLEVRGTAIQSQPLQRWQNHAGDTLAEITGNGELRTGGDVSPGQPNALIEASAVLPVSAGRPLRGWLSRGQITGAIADVIGWIVHELDLQGVVGGVVSGLHSALQTTLKLSHTGSAASAEVRAAEFEIDNAASPVGRAVGVRSSLTNRANAQITEAIAFEVAPPINEGTLDKFVGLQIPDLPSGANHRAIQTGSGPSFFGDFVELKAVDPPPANPAPDSNVVRLYPKNDGKLYARNDDGIEYDLTGGTGGTGGSSRKVAILGW